MTGQVHPCARCGVRREARPTSILCKDCVSVLTTAELRLWKKAA